MAKKVREGKQTETYKVGKKDRLRIPGVEKAVKFPKGGYARFGKKLKAKFEQKGGQSIGPKEQTIKLSPRGRQKTDSGTYESWGRRYRR